MNTCVFSPCRTYRYRLEHVWDRRLPLLAVIMLNPSKADEKTLDATIRRVVAFAKAWGFGGVVVGNLNAYRATDPRVMKAAADPVGPDNDMHLVQIALDCAAVVCAWGQHGKHGGRAEHVTWMLRKHVDLGAIEFANDGTPKHPLYLRSDRQIVPYRSRRAA